MQSVGCIAIATGHACMMLCDGAGDEEIELTGGWPGSAVCLRELLKNSVCLIQRQREIKGWKR